jgi:hypothetical protein
MPAPVLGVPTPVNESFRLELVQESDELCAVDADFFAERLLGERPIS